MAWLNGLWRDLRYGARRLVRQRVATATAVVTLALGVGATTAVFGVLDAVVLRAVPGSNGSRLVILSYTLSSSATVVGALNHDGVDDAASRRSVFEIVAAWKRTNGLQWSEGGQLTPVLGFEVSPRFFELFEVRPELGRWFSPNEDEPGRSRVVMLADSFWRSAFNANPSIIGRVISLSGASYQVVGVMPAGFDLPNPRAQVWVPDTATADERANGQRDHYAIGLLGPHVTLDAAHVALAAMPTRVGEDLGLPVRFGVIPLRDQLVGPVGRVLVLLFGAVGLVLAVACGNVAILRLVQNNLRTRENALRLALGATGARLLREVWAESVLLGGAGALLGAGFAALALWAVRVVGPSTIPRLLHAEINPAVMGVAIMASLAASVIAGVAPAFRSLRVNIESSLGDGLFVAPGGGSLASRHRGQALLAIGQLVLVTVLLVGAGLFLRSLVKLLTVDVGFNPVRLLAVSTNSPRISGTISRSQDVAAQQSTLDHLLADVRSIPGVESVGAMTQLPTGVGGMFQVGIGVESGPGNWTAMSDRARTQDVSDDLFRTMGMRVLAGRTFTPTDTWGAPRVVVVSEAFARIAWPGQVAVGKFINLSMGRDGRPAGPPVLYEVVGVVPNIRYDLAAGAEPQIYYPRRQQPRSNVALVVRHAPGAGNLERSIIDRLQANGFATGPQTQVTPMIDAVGKSAVQPRFYSVVLSLFALVALALGAVGVFGVAAHSVAQRTREMGVRLALGARPRDVGWMIVRAASANASIGIIVGVAGAWALTGFLRNLLFEVSPLDVPTFVAAPLIVAATALAACVGPARRAGRIDPVRLLRS